LKVNIFFQHPFWFYCYQLGNKRNKGSIVVKWLWRLGIGYTLVVLTIILAGCISKPNVDVEQNITNTDDNASMNVDLFPKSRLATGKTVFIFDPNNHKWAVYDADGILIRIGSASGGRDFCPDINAPCRTIVGTFTAYRESGPECVSNEFPVGKGGAPMPDCIFFHEGYAIHGASVVPDYNTSHGCIHVTVPDAQWIETQIKPGSTVIVLPYSEPLKDVDAPDATED
jgi:L,D-transpeptidase catalytic domain